MTGMRKFLLYAGAGASGTLVHYATLLLLTGLPSHPLSVAWVVFATTVGAVLGAGANYALNRRLVFVSSRPHFQTMPRFAAVACCGLLVNAAVVAALTATRSPLLVAQLSATAAVLVLGFLLNRRWTFALRPF